jgi:hypothetical protein
MGTMVGEDEDAEEGEEGGRGMGASSIDALRRSSSEGPDMELVAHEASMVLILDTSDYARWCQCHPQVRGYRGGTVGVQRGYRGGTEGGTGGGTGGDRAAWCSPWALPVTRAGASATPR